MKEKEVEKKTQDPQFPFGECQCPCHLAGNMNGTWPGKEGVGWTREKVPSGWVEGTLWRVIAPNSSQKIITRSREQAERAMVKGDILEREYIQTATRWIFVDIKRSE